MSESPQEEIKGLISNLKEWLRYQGRLGWLGLPRSEPLYGAELREGRKSNATLLEIQKELGDCQRCRLAQGRTHIVFGEGSPQARLMLVGEGPGEEEDLSGRPFVGAAGQLLNRLLNRLGLTREEVYIANIVKCRPPRNRDPLPDEIAACLPFLVKQIQCLKPRVIVTLGKVATQALLGTEAPITKVRGRWQKFQGIRVMPTFHPSYLLRFERERQKTWADMQQVMEYLAAHETD